MHARPALIAVVDPAAGAAELDCFNALSTRAALAAAASGLPPPALTYHLPALFGMGSLETLEAREGKVDAIVLL